MTDEGDPRPATLRTPRHRVSRKAIGVWSADALVRGVVLGAALLGLQYVVETRWPWWVWTAYAVVALAYLLVMPQVRYRIHRWETTETAVYTQNGWLSRELRVAPMTRVQTVDLHQGPVSRLLGLASVTVTTASAAGPVKLSGLDRGIAAGLVEDLTRRAEADAGDAT